jgi:hypothetical protein
MYPLNGAHMPCLSRYLNLWEEPTTPPPPPLSPYLSGIEGGGGEGGGGGGTFSIMINLAEIGHHIFRCGQHYRNQEMLVWWGNIGGSRYTKKGGVHVKDPFSKPYFTQVTKI